jgi:hypothetical protein
MRLAKKRYNQDVFRLFIYSMFIFLASAAFSFGVGSQLKSLSAGTAVTGLATRLTHDTLAIFFTRNKLIISQRGCGRNHKFLAGR